MKTKRNVTISYVTETEGNKGFGKYSDLCDPNEIDEEQYCRCPLGKRISRFKSTHDNGPEDRIWNLECDAIPSEEMCVSFTLDLGLPF